MNPRGPCTLLLLLLAACGGGAPSPPDDGSPSDGSLLADRAPADAPTLDAGSDVAGDLGAVDAHPDATEGDVAPVDAPPAVTDLDHDGLDDGYEDRVARAYLPFVSLDPNDGCALGGFLFRVSPHPAAPSLLHIIYDHLYQNDCGTNGHVGDDEVFSVTIDPARPAPAGILTIKAISHQGTLCEKTSECATTQSGDCAGVSACDTAAWMGGTYPVVYSSKDKHGSYATASDCSPFTTCFDTCSLNSAPDTPPMQNAGEPNAHLTEDLTTNGFISAANGWTEPSLMHFNPWAAGVDFGGAGSVEGDLTDSAYDTRSCR